MIIDLRESDISDLRILITAKQLRNMVKSRMYELFGLNHGLGKKRYSDEVYRKALQSTFTLEADSLLDMLDDFAGTDDNTEDIIASFIRHKFCAYFDHTVEIVMGSNFVDMSIFSLFQVAKSCLINDVVSRNPPVNTNKYDLFGRLRNA